MIPYNNMVVVEPIQNEEKKALSSFIPTKSDQLLTSWQPKRDIEVVRIISGEYKDKLMAVESSQIRSVVYNNKMEYFIDFRYVYGEFL